MRRQCQMEPNKDIREHVDWMTTYADQAFRELQRKVAKIEPKLKINNQAIAKREQNQSQFQKKLLGLLNEKQRASNAAIEELKRDVHIIKGKYIQLQQKVISFRGDLLQEFKSDAEGFTADINGLRSNYHRISQQIYDLRESREKDNEEVNEISNEKFTLMSANFNGLSKDMKIVKENINRFKLDIEGLDSKCHRAENYATKQIKKISEHFNKNKIKKLNEEKAIAEDLPEIKAQLASLKEEISEYFDKNKIKKLNEEKAIAEDLPEIKAQLASLKEDVNKNTEKITYILVILKPELIKFQQIEAKKMEKQEWRIEVEKEGTQEGIKLQQLRMERIKEQIRQNPEKVILHTSFLESFDIKRNSLTYQHDWGIQQLLLNIPIGRNKPFTFIVHINETSQGNIAVGIVDRFTQAEVQSSYSSKNAVVYFGGLGSINFGGEGEEMIGISGPDIMEVRVIVMLRECKIIFRIADKDGYTEEHEYLQGILSQHRQFVPYIEMGNRGDHINWIIQ